MSKIKLVTDSTSDIDPELIKTLDIEVVPLTVNFATTSYVDTIEINSTDFYTRVGQETKMPTTSQPAIGDFVKVYEKYITEGYEVISIHISGNLSGTPATAQTAAQMVDKDKISVIDSKNTTVGLGFLVLEAARRINEGLDKADLVKYLEDFKHKIKLFLLVDTLEYLQKGGRIGKASALIGSLLNIKPILCLEDGTVVPLDKVRTHIKAANKILEIIKSEVGDKLVRVGIAHGNVEDRALAMKEKVQEMFNCEEILVTQVRSSVLGVHTGPGAIAIVYTLLE